MAKLIDYRHMALSTEISLTRRMKNLSTAVRISMNDDLYEDYYKVLKRMDAIFSKAFPQEFNEDGKLIK